MTGEGQSDIINQVVKGFPFTERGTMEKKAWMTLLLDFYGPLLTERQRRAIELSCGEDYSLAEIAESQGISRQGVRDTLMRAEKTLQDLEDKLHLASRTLLLRDGLEAVCEQLQRKGLEEQSKQIQTLWRTWEGE